MKLLLALLLLPSFAFAQKPHSGKVLMHIAAADAGVYKGLQQRSADLEASARDVRRHLGKSKWVKSTDKIEEADIKVVILGRRKDPDKGVALGYSLDAGAYKTEDEIFDVSIEGNVMGGAMRESRTAADPSAKKSSAKYEDLPPQFADSLSAFCEANYERIIAQRK